MGVRRARSPKPSVMIPVERRVFEDPRDQFLFGLRSGMSVAKAAAQAKLDTSDLYKLRNEDQDFYDRWVAAVEDGTDLLEDEAWERATTGKSDYLLAMLLKARRPNVYGERVAVDVRHTIGWEPMSREEWIETYGPAPKVIEHDEGE